MKKIILILMGSLILHFELYRVVLAVWVPETSLEQPVNPRDEQRLLTPGMHPLMDRLENDERQLAAVVEQLKQDEKKIQELTDNLRKKEQAASAVREKK